MEKLILRFTQILFILCTSLLASCNGVVVDEVIGIDANTHLTGHFSQYDNAKISGTGSLRFNAVAPAGSKRSISIRSSLDGLLSGSSLTVVMFSPNTTVPTNSGVTINFQRTGASVAVNIGINGNVVAVNSSRLNFFYPANLDVIIDVHNMGGRSRVLIWRRDVTIYSADTADIDTDRAGDLVGSLPYQTAPGTFNGLHLNFATISAATIGLAKAP